MITLRAAVVQYPLAEGLSEEAFLKKVKGFVEEARAQGAGVVVFPELIAVELVAWKDKDQDVAALKDVARKFTPGYIDWLKELSQHQQISILGGTTPREVEDEIFNTAVLTLPDGRVILQDKLFLTPDEKEWQWSPGNTLKVFIAPWGKSSIATCFDCEFPVVSQMLSQERIDVLFVPSWTATVSGLNRVDWTARARAVEHHAYVLKTGTVPDKNATQPHFGQAGIITPQEPGYPLEPIQGKMNEAGIIYGDLDLKFLRERQKKSGFMPCKEQQERKASLGLETE